MTCRVVVEPRGDAVVVRLTRCLANCAPMMSGSCVEEEDPEACSERRPVWWVYLPGWLARLFGATPESRVARAHRIAARHAERLNVQGERYDRACEQAKRVAMLWGSGKDV